MTRGIKSKRVLTIFLGVVLVLTTLGGVTISGQRNLRRHDRRQRHSKVKGALIGGTAGLFGGAIIGGKKGALIGAGTGAGIGYLIQRHRNQRRHRRHYRRF